MAKSENTGTVIQSWVTPKFAREVRELADQDGRSVSGLIKLALRERLQTFQAGTEHFATSSISAKAEGAPAGGLLSSPAERRRPEES